MGPSFQIFLIFQLLSGGVTNLFSYIKLLLDTCRRVINYVVATDSHTWWENGIFLEKNVKILISQHFEIFTFFHFSYSSVCSQQIFNSWGWNWSQMFTYPHLAITPFRPNGPFNNELSQLKTTFYNIYMFIFHTTLCKYFFTNNNLKETREQKASICWLHSYSS